ncbi:hypothetical protein LQG66_33625 [Bradyrhizobium ontarionense]|uniref:Uncharacterized protein n=1 Tax=Bradyrhizobium ontarionense TaxID=2898149 RepID=A0ABY3RAV8_9BRAD|nr:hypothetical protein [Bradyrhizobium sp. A19]UFZ04079.1 hypothetical protein LQG66_33625 [Bradyrhizobium sp. A19]
MTKVIFMSAALIAAAVITTQAQAAHSSNAAARHAMNRTHTMTDCVRAPKVGAFATAPYTKPPCMPNSMN